MSRKIRREVAKGYKRSVYIPLDLHLRMVAIKEVNWSNVATEAFREEVQRHEQDGSMPTVEF